MADDRVLQLMSQKKMWKVTSEMMCFATLRHLQTDGPLSLNKQNLRLLLDGAKTIGKWLQKLEVSYFHFGRRLFRRRPKRFFNFSLINNCLLGQLLSR